MSRLACKLRAKRMTLWDAGALAALSLLAWKLVESVG